jgi:hypothetical protein
VHGVQYKLYSWPDIQIKPILCSLCCTIAIVNCFLKGKRIIRSSLPSSAQNLTDVVFAHIQDIENTDSDSDSLSSKDEGNDSGDVHNDSGACAASPMSKPTQEVQDTVDLEGALTPTTSISSVTSISSSDVDGGPSRVLYAELAEELNTVISLPTQRISLRLVSDPWITQDLNRRHRHSHIFYKGKSVVPDNLFKYMVYEAYYSPREGCGYVSGGTAYCRRRRHHMILMSIWRNKCQTKGIFFILFDLLDRTITLEDKCECANLYMSAYSYRPSDWAEACDKYEQFAEIYIADEGFETDFMGSIINPKAAAQARRGERPRTPHNDSSVSRASRKPQTDVFVRAKRKPATPPPAVRMRARMPGKLLVIILTAYKYCSLDLCITKML